MSDPGDEHVDRHPDEITTPIAIAVGTHAPTTPQASPEVKRERAVMSMNRQGLRLIDSGVFCVQVSQDLLAGSRKWTQRERDHVAEELRRRAGDLLRLAETLPDY